MFVLNTLPDLRVLRDEIHAARLIPCRKFEPPNLSIEFKSNAKELTLRN